MHFFGWDLEKVTRKADMIRQIAKGLAVSLQLFFHSHSEPEFTLCSLLAQFPLIIHQYSKLIQVKMRESPRKWTGSDGLFTLCYERTLFMLLHTIFAPEKRFRNFRTFLHLKSIPKQNSVSQIVYALTSLDSEMFYIGRTKDMMRRTKEHLTTSTLNTPPHMHTLYTQLMKEGSHTYVLIPLQHATNDVNRLEQTFIKHLKPTLNGQQLHTACSAKQHSKRRKRAPISIRHKYKTTKRTYTGPQHIPLRIYSVKNNTTNNINTGPLLTSLMFDIESTTKVTFSWSENKTKDITKWQSVEHAFGKSIILSPDQFATLFLEDIIHNIQHKQTTSITMTLIKANTNPLRDHMIQMVQQPQIWCKRLPSLPLRTLQQLETQIRKAISSIKAPALSRVQTAMKARYGLHRLPRLTMKLPCTEFNNSGKIREAIAVTLKHANFTEEVQTILLEKTRIVNTTRFTIAQILHNHIPHSKTFNETSTPTCICKDTKHTIRQAENFEGLTYKILNQNSRNHPHPTLYNANNEIKLAFRQILRKLEKLLQQSQANHDSFEAQSLYDPESTRLLHKFNKKIPPFDSVHALLDEAAIIRQIRTQTPNTNSVTTVEEVYTTKRQLEGFILMPLDKNSGKTAVVCPVRYHKMLTDLYVNDSKHFTRQTYFTEANIINKWKHAYQHYKWNKIAAFHTGTLPYGYALAKYKDTARSRIIASYANHPLRKVYQVAQYALMFSLKQTNISHFTLYKTQDLIDKCNEVVENHAHDYKDDTGFFILLADIKEMFTKLPKAITRKAVSFVLENAQHKTRSQHITVQHTNSGKITCSFGKHTNKHEQKCISFQQLFEVVSYDLRNAVFTVGTSIYFQKQGVPMGGFISSAEAICMCAYSEHTWLSSLTSLGQRLTAIRYMDDLLAFISFDRLSLQSKREAEKLRDALQSKCYPPPLTLKAEDLITRNNKFCLRFLEAEVTVTNNHISVSHYNKNIQHLLEHNRQKFKNIQAANSFSPKTSKIGVIFSRVLCIDALTPDLHNKVKAVGLFFLELRFLGYTSRTLQKVCWKMYQRTSSRVWIAISRFLT